MHACHLISGHLIIQDLAAVYDIWFYKKTLVFWGGIWAGMRHSHRQAGSCDLLRAGTGLFFSCYSVMCQACWWQKVNNTHQHCSQQVVNMHLCTGPTFKHNSQWQCWPPYSWFSHFKSSTFLLGVWESSTHLTTKLQMHLAVCYI